jgi:hypothetical protein
VEDWRYFHVYGVAWLLIVDSRFYDLVYLTSLLQSHSVITVHTHCLCSLVFWFGTSDFTSELCVQFWSLNWRQNIAEKSRAEQWLNAGSQAARSLLASSPSGTHGHIFVPSLAVPHMIKREGLNFFIIAVPLLHLIASGRRPDWLWTDGREQSKVEQKLNAGNQAARSLLASSPSGTHGHIFGPSLAVPLLIKREGLDFLYSWCSLTTPYSSNWRQIRAEQ